MSQSEYAITVPDALTRLFAISDQRFVWKPARRTKAEDAYVWKDKIMMLEGFGEIMGDPEDAWVSTGRGRGERRGEGGIHPSKTETLEEVFWRPGNTFIRDDGPPLRIVL